MAQLQLELLNGLMTPREVRETLKNIEKRSREEQSSTILTDTYNDTIERIPKPNRDAAFKALAWIALAKRPLQRRELEHALAVEPDTEELDAESIISADQIIAMCAGLVTIGEGSTIRLIHYTTQQYLEAIVPRWFQDEHAFLANTCITYLSYSDFGKDTMALHNDEEEPEDDTEYSTDSDTSVELQLSYESRRLQKIDKRRELYPFYIYAATFWAHHLKQAKAESQHHIPDFLRNLIKRWFCLEPLVRGELYPHSHYPATEIHAAALHGLEHMVDALIKEGKSPDCRAGSDEETPLQWATQNGHKQVVKRLLDTEQVCAENAIEDATRLQCVDILVLLLGQVEDHCEVVEKAFVRSLRYCEDDFVEAFIRAGVNPYQEPSHLYSSPLAEAIWNGRRKVVQFLLDNGADRNLCEDGWLKTNLIEELVSCAKAKFRIEGPETYQWRYQESALTVEFYRVHRRLSETEGAEELVRVFKLLSSAERVEELTRVTELYRAFICSHGTRYMPRFPARVYYSKT